MAGVCPSYHRAWKMKLAYSPGTNKRGDVEVGRVTPSGNTAARSSRPPRPTLLSCVKSAVPNHIGGQDGSKPTLNAFLHYIAPLGT